MTMQPGSREATDRLGHVYTSLMMQQAVRNRLSSVSEPDASTGTVVKAFRRELDSKSGRVTYTRDISAKE